MKIPDRTDTGMTVEQATLGTLAGIGLILGVLLIAGADDTAAAGPPWGLLLAAFGALNLTAFLVVGALRR